MGKKLTIDVYVYVYVYILFLPILPMELIACLLVCLHRSPFYVVRIGPPPFNRCVCLLTLHYTESMEIVFYDLLCHQVASGTRMYWHATNRMHSHNYKDLT